MALPARSTARSCSDGVLAQTSVIPGTFARLASMKSSAPWSGQTVSTQPQSFCVSASAPSGSARLHNCGIEEGVGRAASALFARGSGSLDLAALGDASRARQHAVHLRNEAGGAVRRVGSEALRTRGRLGTLWGDARGRFEPSALSAHSLALFAVQGFGGRFAQSGFRARRQPNRQRGTELWAARVDGGEGHHCAGSGPCSCGTARSGTSAGTAPTGGRRAVTGRSGARE
jgi:hypothetical protein